jgi:hypothetical protein
MEVSMLKTTLSALIALVPLVAGAQTNAAFWEGYDRRVCLSNQQKVDDAAVASGKPTVLLACTVLLRDKEMTERAERARASQEYVCSESLGKLVCKPRQ